MDRATILVIIIEKILVLAADQVSHLNQEKSPVINIFKSGSVIITY
jgi:hypothetical protein